MKRKPQVALNDDAWKMIKTIANEANDGFKNGHITCSDVVNELVMNAKIDIRALQARHTNIRKSLRLMASQKEIDIDLAIKSLLEMKARTQKRSLKSSGASEEFSN